MTKDTMNYAILFVGILSIITFTPLVSIWAVNTLFGLAIAYTFKTWLASLIITSILSPSVKVTKN